MVDKSPFNFNLTYIRSKGSNIETIYYRGWVIISISYYKPKFGKSVPSYFVKNSAAVDSLRVVDAYGTLETAKSVIDREIGN